MNDFKNSFISQLKGNINENKCYPNLSNIKIDDSLVIAVIDLNDISDILIAIKKLLLNNKNSNINEFAFSIDREATEKQKTLWNLKENNFVTLYYWKADKGWSYEVLEYVNGENDFKSFISSNEIWNSIMKKDLEILEITSILK